MVHLPLIPVKDGYGVNRKASAVLTETEGGKPRSRATVIGSTYPMNVSWVLNANEYSYLVLFHDQILGEGALPFTVDIETLGSSIETHNALFIPGSFALSSKVGQTYIVTAQLDAHPAVVRTKEFAQDYIDAYDEYGDALLTYFNPFEELANVSIPDATGF